MAASRKPAAPTAEAIDRFCRHFDDLFARLAKRTALRHYLIGLLPRERNKTLTGWPPWSPGPTASGCTMSIRPNPDFSCGLVAERRA